MTVTLNDHLFVLISKIDFSKQFGSVFEKWTSTVYNQKNIFIFEMGPIFAFSVPGSF